MYDQKTVEEVKASFDGESDKSVNLLPESDIKNEAASNISIKNMTCGNDSKTMTTTYGYSDDGVETMIMIPNENFVADIKDDTDIKHSRQLVRKNTIHECKFCYKIFMNRSKLLRHERGHTGEKKHSCGVCGKMFVEKYQLKVHVNEVHEKIWSKCEHCGKAYSKDSSLKIHIATVHRGEYDYQCKECGKQFPHLSTYKFHMGKRKKDMIDCDLCDSSLALYCQFKKHSSTHSERRYPCKICGKIFSNKFSIGGHMSMVHAQNSNPKPVPCDRCGELFPLRKMKTHLRLHEEQKKKRPQKALCELCGKLYLKNQRNKHNLLHHNKNVNRIHQCSFCQKRFQLKERLHAHVRRVHKKDKKFHCRLCGSSFVDRTRLTTHTRSHTGEKPFSCPICSSSFSQLGHLIRHKRIHTGERYKCNLCGLDYSQKESLNAHISKVHNDNNTHKHRKKDRPLTNSNKSYPCILCENVFQSATQRNKHTFDAHKTDKGYGCQLCDKAFPKHCLLKVHLRVHSGERPFQCETCLKSFKQIQHLKQHISSQHDGVRYKCDQCDKEYTSSYPLKQHILKAHNSKE